MLPPLRPGTNFDCYRLKQRLAYGSMAEVHLAERRDADAADAPVALKILLPHLCEDAALRAMFAEEARVARALSHENLLSAHDSGEASSRPFLVMEYLSGATLHEIREGLAPSRSPPALDVVLALGEQICRGLHALHELVRDGTPLGLVHHDVSPENILVTDAGGVKVFDFGLTTAGGPGGEGALRGRAAYASPEKVSGRAVDRRADVFAVGVLLFELATGRRLFKRATEPETLLAVMDAEIPPPSQLHPDLPPAFDRVLAGALARDRGERTQTAAALGDALAEVATGPADLAAFVREFTRDLG